MRSSLSSALEDEMNKKQRIILSIGVLAVIVSGLFPPYEGEIRLEGDNRKIYMGYHFLFAPPTGQDVLGVWSGAQIRTVIPRDKLNRFNLNSYIITSRVCIQVVTIVIATLGLLFLVTGKDNKESSNKPDAGDGL